MTNGDGVQFAVLACLVLSAATAAAESAADEVFFDALRERQLVGLLERYCENLLASTDVDAELRGKAVLELAGSLSDRGARTADAAERAALFQRADQLVDGATTAVAARPGPSTLLRYRWAGRLLERARLTGEIAKVAVDPGPFVDAARKAAKQAVALLDAVDRGVAKELSEREPNAKTNPDELTWDQLTQLSSAVEYRLGAAWLALGRVEKDDGARTPRTDALRKARGVLERFAKEYSTLPVTLESHLSLAELLALVSEPKAAMELVERLDRPETPPAFAARARRLKLRFLLDGNQVAAAVTLLEALAGDADPEAGLLRFETMLRQAEGLRPSDPRAADAVQEQALAVLDALEAANGKYWARRGERVLATAGSASGAAASGGSVGLLRRLANVQRSTKQYAAALRTFDRAIAAAEASA
ncbi:MAG: hypothetical protein ACRDD1_12280, partial [Planctomycetia bacterium]